MEAGNKDDYIHNNLYFIQSNIDYNEIANDAAEQSVEIEEVIGVNRRKDQEYVFRTSIFMDWNRRISLHPNQ